MFQQDSYNITGLLLYCCNITKIFCIGWDSFTPERLKKSCPLIRQGLLRSAKELVLITFKLYKIESRFFYEAIIFFPYPPCKETTLHLVDHGPNFADHVIHRLFTSL